MEDTFKSGNYVLISKYLAGKGIDKNDVIIIEHEFFDNDIIKRVIATSGDKVVIDGNEIFINGEPLEEHYAKGSMNESISLVVEEGSVFVLGDNREHSIDSRKLGLIGIDCIEAKVIEF